MDCAEKKPQFEESAVAMWTFTALFFVALIAECKLRRRQKSRVRSRPLLTMVLLTLASLLRAVWFTRRTCGHDTAFEHFINRIAMYLVFSAFTVYLSSWLLLLLDSNLRWTLCGYEPSHAAVNRGVVVYNVLMWAAMLSLSVAYYAHVVPSEDDPEDHGIYDGSVFLAAFASALTGLFSMSIGLRTFLSLNANAKFVRSASAMPGSTGSGCGISESVSASSRRGTALTSLTHRRLHMATLRVVAVSFVCFGCFTSRFGFWLYEPITGEYAAPWTYPTMFYTFPEICPTFVLFVAMLSSLETDGQRPWWSRRPPTLKESPQEASSTTDFNRDLAEASSCTSVGRMGSRIHEDVEGPPSAEQAV